MIKDFEKNKIDAVMKIWLDTNINAHHFIRENYWVDNYDVVKEQYMPMARTFIYEEDSIIKGFISIIEGFFIGALFVAKEYQGQEIGLKLIDHCKALYSKLELAVYVENIDAVNFYKRCGFKIQVEQANKDSGFTEYLMDWQE
ncbi:N-acetyltransferase [Pelosinus sp. UFO1]|uniref:N-acetyltransferase n=1 Tax=Pelosinus sp. UFO1 TaxID=484770 RepID=UPI0004D1DAE8|nr:N-acetyltransferase [Pelosinus sp. UFO1]AIF53065.1 GCN5-related N-acetyltransferase [Pelosinus sp. UFO1]